jgi:stage V sporulation protein SpoVS
MTTETQQKPLKVKELRLTRVRREMRPRANIVRTIPTEPYLKCAASTPPNALAKTIYRCLMEHTYCEVSALFEGANFQALKAVAKATSMAALANVRVQVEIGFVEPRPIDPFTKQPSTGFVFLLRTNLIKNDDGKIVRTA